MKIAVCIKQVPESGSVAIDPETKTIVRSSADAVMNPLDEFPLEAALRIKDSCGAQVSVFTMGPPRSSEVLARAMAAGADNVILLSDRHFAGSDTWTTSLILSTALRKKGPFDLIICGKQAIDGDTGQVGPEVAEHLGVPMAANVCHFEVIHRPSAGLRVRRLFENSTDETEILFPALVTVLKEACEPRFGTLGGRLRFFEEGIEELNASELGLSSENIGLRGSPTRVIKTSAPEISRKTRILVGTMQEKARELAEIIKERLKKTLR
ncbi:MAG: hypothetical protein A2020_15765 [Lentisphaerae bacterium GWF2_45_14]|nr:MAG: hypothetical protein A2020_15765 [Lentisphaerae bacterium GWF2_45_14]